MQITVVGDEIRVDGASVGVLYGGPRREREALRDALRGAPELECEAGGPGFLNPYSEELAEELDDAKEDAANLRAAIERAIRQIKSHEIKDALRTLEIIVD